MIDSDIHRSRALLVESNALLRSEVTVQLRDALHRFQDTQPCATWCAQGRTDVAVA